MTRVLFVYNWGYQYWNSTNLSSSNVILLNSVLTVNITYNLISSHHQTIVTLHTFHFNPVIDQCLNPSDNASHCMLLLRIQRNISVKQQALSPFVVVKLFSILHSLYLFFCKFIVFLKFYKLVAALVFNWYHLFMHIWQIYIGIYYLYFSSKLKRLRACPRHIAMRKKR